VQKLYLEKPKFGHTEHQGFGSWPLSLQRDHLYIISVEIIIVWQGSIRHVDFPQHVQPDPVDKWSLLRHPSLSGSALDDIVTKILNDDSADVESLTVAPIGHDAGDVMPHTDQWDHAELSDMSAKSQSCTSDVFSFDGYKHIVCDATIAVEKR